MKNYSYINVEEFKVLLTEVEKQRAQEQKQLMEFNEIVSKVVGHKRLDNAVALYQRIMDKPGGLDKLKFSAEKNKSRHRKNPFVKAKVIVECEGAFDCKIVRPTDDTEGEDVNMPEHDVVESTSEILDIMFDELRYGREYKLDVYQALYYSLCCYIHTAEPDDKEQYEEFLVNGKNSEILDKCMKNYYKGNSPYKKLFSIEWEPNKRKRKNIWKVSSNAARIWILERNLREFVGEHPVHETKRILNYLDEQLEKALSDNHILMKPEDYWFLEELIGFNTAYMIYNWLSYICREISLPDIERLEPQIAKLVKVFLVWPGQISRKTMIDMTFKTVLLDVVSAQRKGESISIEQYLDTICNRLTPLMKREEETFKMVMKEVFCNVRNENRTINVYKKGRSYLENKIEELRWQVFTGKAGFNIVRMNEYGKAKSTNNDALKSMLFTKVIFELKEKRNTEKLGTPA